jgi:hypothetical protein
MPVDARLEQEMPAPPEGSSTIVVISYAII